MGLALTTGVTGLKASQEMLDVAGNNLANINTTAFKSSTVTFSELLSQTMKSASAPTANTGGTNPQQVGSGVGIAGITRNLSQGNIVTTGNALDMAIDGQGYFVLNNGQQDVYTRIGTFGVNNNYLVDSSTGYRVQRMGSMGETDGFQTPGVDGIRIPYDTILPAKATSKIVVGGNLSPDSTDATQQVLDSDIVFTVNNTACQSTTAISALDQFSGTFGTDETGTITITGTQKDGTEISTDNTLDIDGTTTIGELIDKLNSILTDSTASVTEDGKIEITDDKSGYSKTDINLEYSSSASGTDKLTMPGYFEISTAGGNETQNVNIAVYDALGGAHTLNAAFVRTDTANTWDLVLKSITGDVSALTQRRIEGITFSTTTNPGAYNGLSDPAGTTSFGIKFAQNDTTTQNINVVLGTIGKFDGITQFGGGLSTAQINTQDGYSTGQFSGLSISPDGVIVGNFTNGAKKNIATIEIATFQNPAGLESVGKGYYVTSANSGEAMVSQAANGGAGKIVGNSLEKSNVDVATEFVNMIEAQNAYQANARTISVATTLMSTLTNLIR